MSIDLLNLFPKNKLGSIEIAATLRERYVDTLQLTQHPVEKNAPITDHAFKRPKEVVLECAWSNSSLEALGSLVVAVFSGNLSAADYVGSIYSQLVALQEALTLFDIVTSKRQYQNMQIVDLRVDVDQQTSSVLKCVAACREVIVVETVVATMPPKENQATPQSTASTENMGTKQAVTATPSPGGSLPVN